mmetsp:Transcript_79852/g.140929  ORF Transcript_79852/g.140929 Transcript_79852/m.140929 type:complete len:205 (-) Transcript_79852:32-646(-)
MPLLTCTVLRADGLVSKKGSKAATYVNIIVSGEKKAKTQAVTSSSSNKSKGCGISPIWSEAFSLKFEAKSVRQSKVVIEFEVYAKRLRPGGEMIGTAKVPVNQMVFGTVERKTLPLSPGPGSLIVELEPLDDFPGSHGSEVEIQPQQRRRMSIYHDEGNPLKAAQNNDRTESASKRRALNWEKNPKVHLPRRHGHPMPHHGQQP